MARKNCTHIGGQAVLEGVMMRGKGVMATAVRDPYGEIQIDTERFKQPSEKNVFFRIPIIRGVVNFFSSMVVGMKTLTKTAEVYGDDIDEAPSKFEKWLAKTFKIDIMQVAIAIGIILGVLFAVGIFIVAPVYITKGIFKNIDLSGQTPFLQSFYPNLTAGLLKLVMFILYILLIGQMKDIKRLFRYHGAEHKTISAYEKGLPLTVENVQKQTTVHDRCGTTFIIIVFSISIIIFSFVKWHRLGIVNALIRIALLPLIMGVSYEALKFFAKFDNWFVKILKAPGLLMQKLTTKQPDDQMVEVAIVAFNKVLEMEANPDLENEKFILFTPITKAKLELEKILQGSRKNEVDLIIMDVCNVSTKSELAKITRLDDEKMTKAKEIAEKCKNGMPLQYASNTAHFYGIKFYVDQNVLIPRFDTELLAEQVIKYVGEQKGLRILDLCTGSGAIALAIKNNIPSSNTVVGTDISAKALEIANKNANDLNLDVSFMKSDCFEKIEGKFDVIVSNPPYIKTEDIKSLDSIVRDYEPTGALDGGEKGLDFYTIIANEYKKYLTKGGVLMLEIGIDQLEDVKALFKDEKIDVVYDYNNPPIARVLIINENEDKAQM